MMTTRTSKILAVKTCPDKARQPSYGKVRAHVLRHIIIKDVCANDKEQNARDITEDKEPE
ncbi:MAG TPA: hypothetical protein VIH54_01265 [Chthoniobacterales bacterium]|jgi:hypothetical protein